MTVQALTLPVDIAWQRLAFSADMVDTDYDAETLPVKWRSSMCVFGSLLPVEQTQDAYPNGRVLYLRLCCSITGWNPSEELLGQTADEAQFEDNVQRLLWEAIESAGWSGTYYPCLGAIAQIAIYPQANDVSIGHYPYIVDFEPKKRELYETRSETGEVLSGSSDKLNVQKGTTTTENTEESNILTGVSASASVLGSGGSASVSGEWGTRKKTGTETVSVENTDTSRERRETVSFSTSINQMYQLFNGYHLGTNRALFLILPRPHTVADDAEQIMFNLFDGPRRLEGLQDVFLVVYVPNQCGGVCLQANLDTGHPVEAPWDPQAEAHTLVVTRRTIRTCVRFTDSGRLEPPITTPGIVVNGWVSHELPLDGKTVPGGMRDPASFRDKEARVRAADEMNHYLRHTFARTMLSAYTAGRDSPKPFARTRVFRQLATATLTESSLDLDALVADRHLTKAGLEKYRRAGIRTVGDLFRKGLQSSTINTADVIRLREHLVDLTIRAAKPPGKKS